MSAEEETTVVSLTSNDGVSFPLIAVICVVIYLVALTIIWFVRKCLMNQGLCKQCTGQCDCCLWIRDCCLCCGQCCHSCSVNGCLDSMSCPRRKYYCIDLMCCICLCPENSPCVNCCDDISSGSCECCGCQLNFSMAAQTARSPRQLVQTQQPGYPIYQTTSQGLPLGGFVPPSYLAAVPQPIFGGPQSTHYPSVPGTYPTMATGYQPMPSQMPRLQVRP